MAKKRNSLPLFTAAFGTIVEYYDYAAFAIFMPLMAPILFPAKSAYGSLIIGYAILSISALTRPLGAMVFGFIGDVYGRRRALIASILGIALATLVIGITPTYATIGIWSTVMILLAKSGQVFCYGGEYNGAGIYVIEHAENYRSGRQGSLVTAMAMFGGLVASLIGILVTQKFMPAWSWRLPFILGALLGFVGMYFRKNLIETPHFVAATDQQRSWRALFRKYPRELLVCFFIGGFATVPYSTVNIFINPVLMTKGYFTSQTLMITLAYLCSVAILTLLVAGYCADKFSSRRVIKLAAVSLTLLSFPLLWLIEHGNFTQLIIAETILIIINEVLLGPSSAYMNELFSMPYRYRAISLAFGMGMTVFGGLTAFIEGSIYAWGNHIFYLAVWPTFIGLGTLLSIQLVERKSNLPGYTEILAE